MHSDSNPNNAAFAAAGLRSLNAEIVVADTDVVRLDARVIAALKQQAAGTLRQRARICAHRDAQDRVHEMLIVHTRDAYVQPHKHLGKSESFHVIEGEVEVVLFDERGDITDVIAMGEYGSGRKFYYRLSGPIYHTLLFRSEVVVFHEVTNGPFVKGDAVFAPWAPEEQPEAARRRYVAELAARVESFRKESRV